MVLLYSENVFLHHETGDNPEKPDRFSVFPKELENSEISRLCRRMDIEPCTKKDLLRVHSANYINQVWSLAKSGGGYLDPDTVVGPSSYEVALLAAGCCSDAVRKVMSGPEKTALCLVRPPGHHALANRAMGFCIFNNVAIAAKVASDELGVNRILIVDWDIHHGNGTQAVFWEDPRVGFMSIHRWPFYPGTGSSEETGAGDGLGYTLNIPMSFGVSRKEYLKAFVSNLEKFSSKIRPELILISAGFDTHKLDPVGNLGLESEDFTTLTDAVLNVAKVYCDGKVVSILEGGYNPKILSESILFHLQSLSMR